MPKCKSCDAQILFVIMHSGKKMPVDAQKTTIVLPNEAGCNGHLITGHIPHWVTCPGAAEHRKDKSDG